MTGLSVSLALGLNIIRNTGGGVSYEGPEIVLIGYGQSNWLNHVGTTSSPAAAATGTFFWNGTAWEAASTGVNGNGARALLNSIATATGKTVGLISGGQSGVNIAALQPGAGTGYFEALATKITNADAGSAEENWIVWLQGEGDADSALPPSAATYAANMDTMHANLVSALGRTKSECPFICASLAGWVGGIATDSSWNAILNAQVTGHDTYPNMHYSHSNRRFSVSGDGAHWNLASYYGLSGGLYARTILALRGSAATRPNWSIASAEIVDATNTDVHLSHSMGTDFTPTSGITGFTLSADGFSTTVTPSAAVRQDADTIRLTHSSMSINANRTIRYQYGKLPDITAPVLDNSALAAPLNHSAGQTIIAPGAAADPVLTQIAATAPAGGGPVQSLTSIDLSPNVSDMSYIVAAGYLNSGDIKATGVSITPSGGSPIGGTLLYGPPTGTSPYTEFWKVDVPAGTPGMNNANVSVTLSEEPWSTIHIAVASVPSADVNSWTPVDTDTVTGTGTALSLNISTTAGGFYYAMGMNMYDAGATSALWTGDEPPVERNDYSSGYGNNFTMAIANECADHTNDNTITCTYANSGAMRLSAIAIR